MSQKANPSAPVSAFQAQKGVTIRTAEGRTASAAARAQTARVLKGTFVERKIVKPR